MKLLLFLPHAAARAQALFRLVAAWAGREIDVNRRKVPLG